MLVIDDKPIGVGDLIQETKLLVDRHCQSSVPRMILAGRDVVQLSDVRVVPAHCVCACG